MPPPTLSAAEQKILTVVTFFSGCIVFTYGEPFDDDMQYHANSMFQKNGTFLSLYIEANGFNEQKKILERYSFTFSWILFVLVLIVCIKALHQYSIMKSDNSPKRLQNIILHKHFGQHPHLGRFREEDVKPIVSVEQVLASTPTPETTTINNAPSPCSSPTDKPKID